MATTARVGVDITARDMTGRAFSAVQGKIAGMERALDRAKRVMGSFAAATVGAAFGNAMKSAIDRMDDMGKAAQRMGVGVENLSRLGLAAKLSDVSIEQLGTSFGKLNRNMAAIAAGDGGEAGRAFRAIGVSVTDAAGKLKSGDVVIEELAGKFSRMQDGAGKAALAMAIFGKSGADMIPLLNGGAAAMRDLGDEADRTGQTISESTARNAEVLNDNIARLYGRADGFANLLAQKLIPDLIDWSDSLLGVADSGTLAESTMKKFDESKKGIGGYLETSLTELNAILNLASGVDDAFAKISNGNVSEAAKALGDAWKSSTDIMHGASASVEMLRQQVERLGKGSLPSTITGADGGKLVSLKSAPFIPAAPKRAKIDREHNAALAEAKRIYEGTRSAAEAYGDTLQRLDELKTKGLINQETYNRALFDAKWALGESKVEAVEAAQEFLNLGDVMKGGFDQAFSSIMDGTRSVSGAFRDMGQSILQSVTSTFANKAFSYLIDAILGTAGHGLYGGGGSGLLGALPSFAVGTSRVPRDMVAQIHEGEAIIPARQAEAMRRGGGGGTTVNVIDQRRGGTVERQDDGMGNITLMIRDAVKQQLPGQMAKQMPGQFGINPTNTRR